MELSKKNHISLFLKTESNMCPFKNSNTGLVNMSKKDEISLERFTMCINY